jgi:hypothetical protein
MNRFMCILMRFVTKESSLPILFVLTSCFLFVGCGKIPTPSVATGADYALSATSSTLQFFISDEYSEFGSLEVAGETFKINSKSGTVVLKENVSESSSFFLYEGERIIAIGSLKDKKQVVFSPTTTADELILFGPGALIVQYDRDQILKKAHENKVFLKLEREVVTSPFSSKSISYSATILQEAIHSLQPITPQTILSGGGDEKIEPLVSSSIRQINRNTYQTFTRTLMNFQTTIKNLKTGQTKTIDLSMGNTTMSTSMLFNYSKTLFGDVIDNYFPEAGVEVKGTEVALQDCSAYEITARAFTSPPGLPNTVAPSQNIVYLYWALTSKIPTSSETQAITSSINALQNLVLTYISQNPTFPSLIENVKTQGINKDTWRPLLAIVSDALTNVIPALTGGKNELLKILFKKINILDAAATNAYLATWFLNMIVETTAGPRTWVIQNGPYSVVQNNRPDL